MAKYLELDTVGQRREGLSDKLQQELGPVLERLQAACEGNLVKGGGVLQINVSKEDLQILEQAGLAVEIPDNEL